MAQKYDNFLSVSAAAERLNINDQSVRRLIHHKKLRATLVGGVYRIAEEWLSDFIESNATTESVAPPVAAR